MIESRHSLTAERVAMRRALHQLVDVPLIHEDPLAVTILGADRARELEADARHVETHATAWRLRAFVAVRSRIAEERLARAVAAGVDQYVVLGAGLDTFAYRNPHPALRVFEVDHPDTQAWKRRRLAEARIEMPESAVQVPVDFTKDPLPRSLLAAGVDREVPTVFSWLGVTPYLEPAVVSATLADLAPFARGGGAVVFDYLVPPGTLPRPHRAAIEALAARTAAAGEPMVGFFAPERLALVLRAAGFDAITDQGPDELNAGYFARRADGLEVGRSGHVVTAWGDPARTAAQ
jgi:methyltransferase (TIGR00027 family)